MLLTLAKLKTTKGNKLYSQPLKDKVCGVSSTSQYQVESGEEKKEYCVLGIADHSMAMRARVGKCLCFTDVVVTSFNEETRRSDTTATKTVTGLQEDTTPVEGGGRRGVGVRSTYRICNSTYHMNLNPKNHK